MAIEFPSVSEEEFKKTVSELKETAELSATREIIREELESALKSVQLMKRALYALSYNRENISIFICDGSTHAKKRKIWDSCHGCCSNPFETIIEAIENINAQQREKSEGEVERKPV